MMYKMGSASSLRLKPHVVPHINLPDQFGMEPAIEPELLIIKSETVDETETPLIEPEISIIEPEISTFQPGTSITRTRSSIRSEAFVNENSLNVVVQSTINRIRDNSKNEIGISLDSLWVIKTLSNHTEVFVNDIYLILMKIRQNDDFYRLGYFFGISETFAEEIFKTQLPIVTKYVEKLILRPPCKSIKKNIPISFRSRYNQVQVIINFFYVRGRPSIPPDYDQIVKFLISSTPDGLICYVSEGFRSSEVEFLMKSNYLRNLPKYCVVMIDRDVTDIEKLVAQNDCLFFMGPPNIGSVPNKQTRNEIAICSHIQRTLRKFGEFKFLGDVSEDMDRLNNAMKIAAGLINLENHL